MGIKNFDIDLFQDGNGSHNLIGNVDAVFVIIDHLVQTVNLSLCCIEQPFNILLFCFHGELLSLGTLQGCLY